MATYNVGDVVRIIPERPSSIPRYGWPAQMNKYLDATLTIRSILSDGKGYLMVNTPYSWSDEMIVGLDRTDIDVALSNIQVNMIDIIGL